MSHFFDSTGIDRRTFLKAAAVGAVAASSLGAAGLAHAADAYPAPPLPYVESALEPFISARTVSFHYGKHTAGYYRNVNKMIKDSPYAGMSLEALIVASNKDGAQGMFNNAAQAWNHTFYWAQFTERRGAFKGKAAEAVTAAFGGYEPFKKLMLEAAAQQFASGWVWLVQAGGALKVVRTPNAMTPLVEGMNSLMVVDVWEHAYYLDYQNRRGDHVAAVLDNLIDWSVIASRMT